jgi:hypothetical protein
MPQVRTKTYIIYTASELQKLYPQAFQKALDWYRHGEDMQHEIDEAVASYQCLLEQLRIRMYDYSLSLFDYRNFVKFRDHDALNLEGVRAYKYVVNALDTVRSNTWVPLSLLKGHPAAYDHRKESWGKPWAQNDCPLTGVCYDELVIEKTLKYCLEGESLFLPWKKYGRRI